jgi:four helix bundle protein
LAEVISSFRDLRVWQQGMDLVEQIYEVSRDFPKHEIYGLASQMRRAAVSIPANIAEGHIRRQPRAYQNYVSIALGSLAELQTEMELARRLGYVSEPQYTSIDKHTAALARQLQSLRNSLSGER